MKIKMQNNDGFAYIEYEKILAKSKEATLYSIHGEEIWIPNSQIEEDNGDIVVIPQWLADKKDLEGDY